MSLLFQPGKIGNMELRNRFVRSAVGPDYPLLVKINAEDFAKTGVDPDACVVHCRKLDELGIAAIEVGGGIAEKGLVTIKGDIPMDLLLQGRGIFERMVMRMMEGSMKARAAFEEAFLLPQAAVVKKNVKVPLLAVGGMRTRKKMEDVLEKGQADFISMCRPFIRQPNLVKLLEGDGGDPTSCTSCNRCSLEILLHNKPMRCYQT